MIQRIVKMTFRPESVPTFEALFATHKQDIRNQPGCLSLRLLQDIHSPHIFFTYSTWQTETELNAYRNSATFAVVWPATKALFAARPEAWSVDVRHELP